MNTILIVGATSAIANSTARLFADRGDTLFLIARNDERLRQAADDLRARGAAAVETATLDINDMDAHDSCIRQALDTLGKIDIVLIAHGTLPDQARCEADTAVMTQEFATNASSTLCFLNHLVPHMVSQSTGKIAVITSVAGDRGRQSNYVYGAAKAAVATYLSGLRNRLAKQGIAVLDIRPGFVDTPMTSAFKKGALWAQPEQIAAGIVRALEKNADVVYLPFFWRYIMLIIRLIPEAIFKRLSL